MVVYAHVVDRAGSLGLVDAAERQEAAGVVGRCGRERDPEDVLVDEALRVRVVQHGRDERAVGDSARRQVRGADAEENGQDSAVSIVRETTK